MNPFDILILLLFLLVGGTFLYYMGLGILGIIGVILERVGLSIAWLIDKRRP